MRRPLSWVFPRVLLPVILACGVLPTASAPPAAAADGDAMPFVMKLGGPPGIDDALEPGGVASDGTYLYVADTRTDRLGKWRLAGLAWVAGTGSWGAGNDQFAGPAGVATDGAYVYVADAGNPRIVKRKASDLSFVAAVGNEGPGSNQFRSPAGVAVSGGFRPGRVDLGPDVPDLELRERPLEAAEHGPHDGHERCAVVTHQGQWYTAQLDRLGQRLEHRHSLLGRQGADPEQVAAVVIDEVGGSDRYGSNRAAGGGRRDP